MKIELILLGKTKEDYLDRGIQDYAKRLQRYIPLEIKYIKTKAQKKQSESEIKRSESRLVEDYVTSGSFRCALDSSGNQYESEKLAELLSTLEQQGIKTMSFVIGGHLGLDAVQLAAADLVLSLSKMTFTHDMSRLILLEQLYRAFCIKAGTKYHK